MGSRPAQTVSHVGWAGASGRLRRKAGTCFPVHGPRYALTKPGKWREQAFLLYLTLLIMCDRQTALRENAGRRMLGILTGPLRTLPSCLIDCIKIIYSITASEKCSC